MPELPEVETMVRGLRPALVGRYLRRVEIRDSSLLQNCSAGQLQRRATGSTVLSVDRRGKWVVLTLGSHGGMIVIQPRMTGGFWLRKPERQDHVRAVFHLDKPRAMVWYCDTRRLGRIAWYSDASAAEEAFQRSHGPDALEIRHDQLVARLKRTRRAIKAALMDQKLLAGIGNIYADEVLHEARIHPKRCAELLEPAEVRRLHRAVRKVLTIAISLEGSSFDAAYRTVLGEEGGFLAQNAVYGRENQPCPRCSQPIRKTRFAGLIGRSTYFCPHCQRGP
jgi:formamidopyrimidine-DNA glycosylase